MKDQIKNIINEAGQQIAYSCFKKVTGQIDLVKADKIAEEYAEKVEIAAAPCKNKVEELGYLLKENANKLIECEKIRNQLYEGLVSHTKAVERIKNGSFWQKIKWAFGA